MAAKRTIFQSTFLGMSEDPKRDGCWENMWNTIQNGNKEPFKYVDRLEIAFAEIDATNPDNAFLCYKGPNQGKAIKTIEEAKKENRSIQIIAQMAWAKWLSPLVEDPEKALSRLDTFAKSIPSFLKNYKLEGIDFDWEFDQIDPVKFGMTTSYATHLFTLTRESIGRDKIMTITPDGDFEDPTKSTQSLNIEKVNELFDAVISIVWTCILHR